MGEGESNARSAFKKGEGEPQIVIADPSSGTDFVRATFSHMGRRK
jgi:hypothetical protein